MLRKGLPMLTVLKLSWNNCGSGGLQALAQAIVNRAGYQAISKLQKIEINDNNVDCR